MIEKLVSARASHASLFVVLTYSLSWIIWISTWFATGRPATSAESPAMVAAVYAGSFGPGVAAAILTLANGRDHAIAWLSGFIRFRCGWRSYAAALLPLPIALLLLTILFSYEPRMENGGGMPALAFYATIFPIAIFNGLMTALLGAGPIGEEGGWRGYLLPRLLEQGGELRASLVIGVVWSLWHLPIMAMFADWRGGMPFIWYLPLYMTGATGLSFLLSRVWVLGKGSLVPCIWLHGVVNAVGGMAFDADLWMSEWSPEFGNMLFAAAAFLAAAVLMKARPPAPA